MDHLVLRDCRLVNTTLAFEYSSVDADVRGTIDSVFNPSSGTIRADYINELDARSGENRSDGHDDRDSRRRITVGRLAVTYDFDTPIDRSGTYCSNGRRLRRAPCGWRIWISRPRP